MATVSLVCQVQSSYWKSLRPTFQLGEPNENRTTLPIAGFVDSYLSAELNKLGLRALPAGSPLELVEENKIFAS